MMYFNFGFTPMMPFMGMGMYPTYQTGQPNFGLWSSNPCNLLGNFGGTYQFSTYPTEYTLSDIMACKNADNPFYFNNYFLNTFMSLMNPYAGLQQEQMKAQAGQMGYNMGVSAGLNIGISSADQSLASLKYQVEQALGRDDLTDEQRQNLEICKEQIESLQQRMEQLKQDKNTNSRTYEELQTELRSINASSSEISRLKEQILKKADFVDEEDEDAAANQNGNNGGVDNPDNNDDDAEAAGAANQNGNAGQAGNAGAAGNLQVQNAHKNVSAFKSADVVDKEKLGDDIVGSGIDDPEVTAIGNKLFQMIKGYCSGGSNSEIKEYIEQNINKDNVVEVMLYWNQNFAAKFAEDDKNGMMESIFDEFSAFGKDAVKPFVTALQERLEEYAGVDAKLYAEASAELADAYNEVDSWYCYEDKAAKAINKGHKAIVKLMEKVAEKDNK